MEKQHPQEKVWTPDAAEIAAGLECALCGRKAAAGERFAACPRCRAVHHLSCWVENGGCATRGCRQLVDPALRPPQVTKSDPAPRDNMWIPILLTVLALAVVAGTILWGIYGNKGTKEENHIVLLLPSGPAAANVHTVQLAADAKQFAAGRSDIAGATIVDVPPGPLYNEKLVLMIMGKDPPDILLVDRARFSALVANNGVLPVDELVTSLRRTPLAGALAAGKQGGRLWGVPYETTEWLLCISSSSKHPAAARELLLFVAGKTPVAP